MWITRLTFILLVLFSTSAYPQSNNDIQLANEYYNSGELAKAREIYEKVIQNPQAIPLVHENYLNTLIDQEDYPEAERYLRKVIKLIPGNIEYQLDLGYLMIQRGDAEKGDQYFKKFIEYYKQDIYKTRISAQYFVNNRLTEYAILAFKSGREAMNNPYLFSLEMANLYRMNGEKGKMVQEYLGYVTQNPKNVNYVKNTLQNLLTEPEEFEELESSLLDKVQDDPENAIYGELLIWVNLQQKNFYGAFIQSRALDVRSNSPGSRSLQIGFLALQNGDFRNARRIFQYVMDEYPESPNYKMAYLYYVQSKEQEAKGTYPIDTTAIVDVIKDYDDLIGQFGIDNTTADGVRNQAKLYAFYLDRRDSAIQILNKILGVARISTRTKSAAKLDLGDIYILIDEPWESALLYSQVEKSMRESELGYEAKLKNAKLSYYRGDFELAQSHLDVLKKATSREISNDAISLSILIKDNTGLDTSDVAMQDYASIDLLLYQNRKDQALEAIDKMLKTYQGHSLTDELLWLRSNVYLETGFFEKATADLNIILEDHGDDILADDAYFMMGTIYEEYLGDPDRAMTIYEDFLKRFPGSIYTVESRKRFRSLRGDFKYDTPLN